MQQQSPSPSGVQPNRIPRSLSRWANAALASLTLLGATSCSIHFDFPEDFDFNGHKHESGQTFLSEVETNDGRTTTYSLSGRPRHFPSGKKAMQAGILISTKAALNVPYLGLNVTSVDTSDAEQFGIVPWEGVLVTKVEAESAAAFASLERGDLILAVDGRAIGSEEQFAELVAGSLLPGDEITLDISRVVAEFTRKEMAVPLLVGSRSIEETEADRVNLQLDGSLVARTGLGIATVPADLADEIYGIRQSTPLVAAVVTGSPAYFAGVRAGDRVLKVGGYPVDTVDELRRQIGKGGGNIDLQLDGPLGPHGASFEVREDVLVESDFEIPIIVDYESRADRTSLSVLEFIFLFGYSKDVEYHPSKTRNVNKTKRVSILPLGMFEFTRTPTKRTNRILWFITWSSRV